MKTVQIAALMSIREKLRVISLIAGAAAAEAYMEHLQCDRVAPNRPYSVLIKEALEPFARLHERMLTQLHAAAEEPFDADGEAEGGINLAIFPNDDKPA